MLDWWNDFSLNLFDFLLGWLLALPRQVAVVAIGLATAALVVIVRKWTTNQDRLGRAAADVRRLKELRRDARDARDKDALARLARTKGQIGILKMKSEGWPLLTILLPVALLATWAFQRIAFHPTAANEKIDVIAYLPSRSAEGDILHLVPQPGLHAIGGWVQEVTPVENELSMWDRCWAFVTFRQAVAPEPDAQAVWQLQGEAADEPYSLVFRWKDQTLTRELRVGQSIYSPAFDEQADESFKAEMRLRETRLLGIPGLGAWLPAWFVGYLLITIPAVPLLKRVLKIY
jgi:uncharacterized membrane protein (DUF106 family)